MINLNKPIIRFSGAEVFRVAQNPETYLKIEDRVYYFYTKENNYLNYDRDVNYLIVTKHGYYKCVPGVMFDITRTKKVIKLEEGDAICSICPIYTNYFYCLTTENRMLIVDIGFKNEHLRITEKSSGKANFVRLEPKEEIYKVVNKFNEDMSINSLLLIDEFNNVKLIDDGPMRKLGKVPKPLGKTKLKFALVMSNLNNNILGVDYKITLLKYKDFESYKKKYNGMYKIHSLFNGIEYEEYELVKGVKY